MIVEKRDQVRLFARHEAANKESQRTAECEKNDNKNIGQRRGEIADRFPLHNDPNITHTESHDAQHWQ